MKKIVSISPINSMKTFAVYQRSDGEAVRQPVAFEAVFDDGTAGPLVQSYHGDLFDPREDEDFVRVEGKAVGFELPSDRKEHRKQMELRNQLAELEADRDEILAYLQMREREFERSLNNDTNK